MGIFIMEVRFAFVIAAILHLLDKSLAHIVKRAVFNQLDDADINFFCRLLLTAGKKRKDHAKYGKNRCDVSNGFHHGFLLFKNHFVGRIRGFLRQRFFTTKKHLSLKNKDRCYHHLRYHLDWHAKHAHLCRVPTHSPPCNAGAASQNTGGLRPFPRALRGPFVSSASLPGSHLPRLSESA